MLSTTTSQFYEKSRVSTSLRDNVISRNHVISARVSYNNETSLKIGDARQALFSSLQQEENGANTKQSLYTPRKLETGDKTTRGRNLNFNI